MNDHEAADLATSLSPEALIRIVDEMEPDEAADLLGDIHPEYARAILDGLEDPEEVRPLLLHPDDTAGGLMTSEYVALRRRTTAREALDVIRSVKPDAEYVYDLFVVDAHGRLVGVLTLRELVLADPGALVGDLMDAEAMAVPVGTDQEACARLMLRYDLLALPVVDEQNRLAGVITIDDVATCWNMGVLCSGALPPQ